MDNNGKIMGKFNVIDIAVILLIIVAIIGFAVRFKSSSTPAVTSDVHFKYVVKVEGVRKFTADALKKHGVVTDKRALEYVGEVVDVEVKDATTTAIMADGSIINATLPDRYDCYISVEANGRESEDGYILKDTTELSIGRNIDFITKYVHTSGTIESIEIVK